MRRTRAFSLPEMLIYTVCFCVVGTLVAIALGLINRTSETTTATYAVTGEADTAIQWLRKDLEESALASIEVDKEGRLSLISARSLLSDPKDPGRIWFSEYGVPRWTKTVFYALRQTTLVRWEQTLGAPADQDRNPKVVAPPAEVPSAVRDVLHNVVAPGARLADVPDYLPTRRGGFRVEFVRRAGGTGPDQLTDENPVRNKDRAGDNTRILEVELAVVDVSTGKPNYSSLTFRVTPRH